MSEIFDEINEELRQERAQALWKKYSKLVYAVVGIIVLGTVGYQVWKNQTESRLNEQALALENAMTLQSDGQNDAAIEALNILGNHTKDGIGMVAKFRAASLLVREGRQDEAVLIYDALAADETIDSLYSDLALIYSVMHRNQTGQEKALMNELSSVNQDAHPYRYIVREVMAGLALSAGDVTQAKALLEQIADDIETPNDYKNRATELLRAIGS